MGKINQTDKLTCSKLKRFWYSSQLFSGSWRHAPDVPPFSWQISPSHCINLPHHTGCCTCGLCKLFGDEAPLNSARGTPGTDPVGSTLTLSLLWRSRRCILAKDGLCGQSGLMTKFGTIYGFWTVTFFQFKISQLSNLNLTWNTSQFHRSVLKSQGSVKLVCMYVIRTIHQT